MIRKFAPIAIIITLATGCDTLDNSGTKRTIGLLGGAGVGGLLGSKVGRGSGQLAATAAGTLLGAFLGNQIGSSLDKADKTYAAEAERRAVSRGQHTVFIGGRAERGIGRACQQADGSWRIIA